MKQSGPFSPIPLPDPLAFEEQVLLKKQRRSLETTPYIASPYPKCPSTPCRSSPYKYAEKQCFTELKRPRCSSNNFEYIATLGEGCFGIVYKARDKKDNKCYAIKKSKKPIWNTTHRSQYMTEIVTTQAMGFHKNITQIHDAWEEGGHIYIQMELCDRSLKEVLNLSEDGVVPEHQIWKYLSDVMQGLHHIHKHKLAHLDIKPENMLVGADGVLKIADMGNSIRLGGPSSQGASLMGLPKTVEPVEGDKVYMAPELLDEQFSLSADIFSVGITMFEMATGVDLPGSGQWWRNLRSGDGELLDRFLNESPQMVPLSASLRHVIKNMMLPDPKMRPSAQTLLEVPGTTPFAPVRYGPNSGQSLALEPAQLVGWPLNC